MKSWRTRANCAYLLHSGLLLIAGGSAGTASALNGDTLRFFVSPSVRYDSNVFRLPDSVNAVGALRTTERSDVITTIAIGAVFDKTWARQRLLVDLRAAHTDYARFDTLDHEAHDGRAVLHWQVGNDWSGQTGYSRARALTNFSDFRLPLRNMQRTDRPYLLAKYRAGASYVARAQVSQTTSENSTVLLQVANRRERMYEAGLDFVPSSQNTIGLFARRVDGSLPNRVVTAAGDSDAFTEDTFGSAFQWRLSGLSALAGYLGYTQRRYEHLAQRDFSGASGDLTYQWTPTGKSTITLSATRRVEPYEDLATTYALTNSIGVAVKWDGTEKVAVTARADYRQREFLGDTSAFAAGQGGREDRTKSAGFGVIYKPSRNIEFAASVARETRSSNSPQLNYTVNTAGITAQLSF